MVTNHEREVIMKKIKSILLPKKPLYLDKAESKKTKIGWFVFTIIAVIFDVFIVYAL